MADPINAVEVLHALYLPADHPDNDGKDARDECRESLAALFSAAGIEGDGDLVLRREGEQVTVAGRLKGVRVRLEHTGSPLTITADPMPPIYRIVEPGDG